MRRLAALRTLAVAVMVMVTGRGPQSKVMIPPAATALTTACEVQLAAVPFPITRVGCEVSAARASAGTVACPRGLPGAGARLGPGRRLGRGVRVGPALGDA